MKTRCVISLIVVGAFVLLSQPAIADDLADLKATHKILLKAVNTGDVKTIFEYWQEGTIWIPDTGGFPMVTKKAIVLPLFTKFFEKNTFRTICTRPTTVLLAIRVLFGVSEHRR